MAPRGRALYLSPVLSKPTFYAACLAYVHLRLDAARAGMAAAQESSNSETKSSAGDKYETGRAMAQQERDRHAAQLHEAQQQLAELQKINPELASDTVRLGAAVATTLGVFYVSIGAGQLRTADGVAFVAVSASAPLLQALAGRRAGEQIAFNNKQIQLLEVS